MTLLNINKPFLSQPTLGKNVEKPIFSITCTTCQARIAVRSEAAIGAILECPKCASMVHIVPPAHWKPAATEPETIAPPISAGGPPPLTRVAADATVVELESAGPLLGRIFNSLWFLWSIAAILVVVIVSGLWWLLNPRVEPAVAVAANHPSINAVSSQQGAPVAPPPEKSPDNPPTSPPATPAAPPSTSSGPSAADDAKMSPNLAPPAAIDTTTTPPPTAETSPPQPEEDHLFPPADDEAAIAAQNNKPANVKKLPFPHIDVTAKMETPLAEIELRGVPLVRIVELLAAMSATPITLDADALNDLGVSPRKPVSLHLQATTLGQALQQIASQQGLAALFDNGQIIINTPQEHREALRQVRYTVSDLTDNDKAALANLAAIVRRLVAPTSWQGNGGRGTIEPEQDALLVTQSSDVHRQVLLFCEKLRAARQKPFRSRDNPDRFSLATLRNQARKILDQTVTANFHGPTPLAAILTFLSETTGSVILVDREAMAAAETSDAVETTLTVEKQPFRAALDNLLAPLGLTYRVLAADVIQITTQEAADEHLELEFYPVAAWLDAGVPGPKLAERLKTRVAASTWNDAGGAGEICFDAPSRYLIVLQAQSVQTAVEKLLATVPRKNDDPAAKAPHANTKR